MKLSVSCRDVAFTSWSIQGSKYESLGSTFLKFRKSTHISHSPLDFFTKTGSCTHVGKLISLKKLASSSFPLFSYRQPHVLNQHLIFWVISSMVGSIFKSWDMMFMLLGFQVNSSLDSLWNVVNAPSYFVVSVTPMLTFLTGSSTSISIRSLTGDDLVFIPSGRL